MREQGEVRGAVPASSAALPQFYETRKPCPIAAPTAQLHLLRPDAAQIRKQEIMRAEAVALLHAVPSEPLTCRH